MLENIEQQNYLKRKLIEDANRRGRVPRKFMKVRKEYQSLSLPKKLLKIVNDTIKRVEHQTGTRLTKADIINSWREGYSENKKQKEKIVSLLEENVIITENLKNTRESLGTIRAKPPEIKLLFTESQAKEMLNRVDYRQVFEELQDKNYSFAGRRNDDIARVIVRIAMNHAYYYLEQLFMIKHKQERSI